MFTFANTSWHFKKRNPSTAFWSETTFQEKWFFKLVFFSGWRKVVLQTRIIFRLEKSGSANSDFFFWLEKSGSANLDLFSGSLTRKTNPSLQNYFPRTTEKWLQIKRLRVRLISDLLPCFLMPTAYINMKNLWHVHVFLPPRLISKLHIPFW